MSARACAAAGGAAADVGRTATTAADMRHCRSGRTRRRRLRPRVCRRAVADIRLRDPRPAGTSREARTMLGPRHRRSVPEVAVHAGHATMFGAAKASSLGAAHLWAAPPAHIGTVPGLNRRPRLRTAGMPTNVSTVSVLDGRPRWRAPAAPLRQGSTTMICAHPRDPVRRAHRDAFMRAPVAIEMGAPMEERPARIVG
jgi:hypothetical protein